jgi:hypothetical protein
MRRGAPDRGGSPAAEAQAGDEDGRGAKPSVSELRALRTLLDQCVRATVRTRPGCRAPGVIERTPSPTRRNRILSV